MNRFNCIQHCSLIISSACMFLMISESDNNKIVTLKNSLVFTNANERQNICYAMRFIQLQIIDQQKINRTAILLLRYNFITPIVYET